MKVPLFELTQQYEDIREEILEQIDQVIRSGKVILGPNVKALETSIAKYLNIKHGVGVANGSDALFIALKALGIGAGDEVITTPYSFFATVSCITRLGATPVFVDIDPVIFNLDLNQVETILQDKNHQEKVKAMIPVHIFGQTVDLERLERIKKDYSIAILEDCAQSIGSKWRYIDGTYIRSGSVGDAATFSFFPTKNLGAYGDGGMIVTDSDTIAEKCSVLRKHGSKEKYFHETVGINSRLDEVQAAILNVKFKHLDVFIEKRIDIAFKYAQLFEEKGLREFIAFPDAKDDGSHVYHQYVIRLKKGNRDKLRDFLTKKEIGTSIYYPKPLHLQPCFETLALPIFPEMKERKVEYVVNGIKGVFI
ncbi:MAG: DegT/DnrJ/EryC1/StrS family aminotransferase [Thermotogota bacterium]|nr:DegT/DnrJ/EryC1/StrS family aminotransferase [Thermotogota bacterium]